ncbi:transposase [Ensifer sp. 4252]|uniref:transposase n=1 Tax=Ensifer sp. 4252 TaxID=3373915 RepID=UPI003D21C795
MEQRRAHLGLTPGRYQSGEADHNGRVSQCGDPVVRAYLFETVTRYGQSTSNWSRAPS